MTTRNNPSRIRKKIHITSDGEYQEEFISRKVIQSHELVILEQVYTNKDYFKALFLPDNYDIIFIFISVFSLWLLKDSLGLNMSDPSALIFIGIFGIFFYTTRYAYFSFGDLVSRIQKNQNPKKLFSKLDIDFSFWGLLFNLVLIVIGSYFSG